MLYENAAIKNFIEPLQWKAAYWRKVYTEMCHFGRDILHIHQERLQFPLSKTDNDFMTGM